MKLEFDGYRGPRRRNDRVPPKYRRAIMAALANGPLTTEAVCAVSGLGGAIAATYINYLRQEGAIGTLPERVRNAAGYLVCVYAITGTVPTVPYEKRVIDTAPKNAARSRRAQKSGSGVVAPMPYARGYAGWGRGASGW